MLNLETISILLKQLTVHKMIFFPHQYQLGMWSIISFVKLTLLDVL